jgi:hypothetical protein
VKASADDAPPGKASGHGWHENVLVWNATVARIPSPAIQPDAAQELSGVERGSAAPSRERQAEDKQRSAANEPRT